MKKYILGIVFLAAIVLAFTISFGSANIETKHYQNGEISFNYPANWQQVPGQGSQVVAFKDPDTGSNITVNRQTIPPGYKVPADFVPELIKESESKIKLSSSNKVDVNGKVAYDNTYQIQGNGSKKEQRELWVNTNGALYSVVYTYPQEGFKVESLLKGISGSESSASFDAIKNSLKIDSSKLPTSPIFGTVSIPKLGVNWNIRYDTLNAASAVYHYSAPDSTLPKSFYPGEKGSMGLLGHHTRFSAPFDNIDKLQTGDIVIIKDYLTQKKYTYKVVSNNDIRYDYTTNLIQFPASSKELVLGTCWPEGFTAAERYVHCQLSSVDPLN
ncbi:MAG: sortase [Methanobacteriaceae archaeon]|nr:sortase [Methanobacteriaceae archaeon]